MNCSTFNDSPSFIVPPTASLSFSSIRSTAASVALAAFSLVTPNAAVLAEELGDFAFPNTHISSTATTANTSNESSNTELQRQRHGRRRRKPINSVAIAVPLWAKNGSLSDISVENSELSAISARRRIAREAMNVFEGRYVDKNSIPWERIERKIERSSLKSDKELENLIRWILSCANDVYTRYLPSGELDGVRDGISGAMEGVGLIFSAETKGFRRSRQVIVKHVVRNSPAFDAGLLKNDQIVAIDTIRVSSMRIDDAAARLAGKFVSKDKNGNNKARKKGQVLITIVRDNDQRELSVMLTRRRFAVPTVTHELVKINPNEELLASSASVSSSLSQVPTGNVAVIQVRDFASRTAIHARRALRKAVTKGNLVGIVLDLRGNSGGLVDQAVSFSKLFLPRNRTVVQFIGRDGAISKEQTRIDRPYVLPPVIILVDERTASASELVLASLRDNCVGISIGTRTFGKGSVQAVVPLSNGTGVAVTVAAYRTPHGNRIADGVGIKPDWFKSDIQDDASGIVKQIYGKHPKKRIDWVNSKLDRCSPANRYRKTAQNINADNSASTNNRIRNSIWSPFVTLWKFTPFG